VRPIEPGRVYLVGAGPGDPELLTLRAAAVLTAADAVFHDQLVSDAVLSTTRRDAERVDVGHRAGSVRHEPAEVAGWMATRARRGQVVARLKGGDPFVFGRGGEEVQALAALGVPCEVVPGVTSALAAPAAAGIPVSHRGLSRSIVIASGHDRDPAGRPAWATPADATLVVLMGSARLAALAAELVEAGWEPDTPAAVVMAATTPRQRQVCGRLGEIAERAAGAGLGPPSVLIVGEVVSLAPLLAPVVAPGLAAGVAWAAASAAGMAE